MAITLNNNNSSPNSNDKKKPVFKCSNDEDSDEMPKVRLRRTKSVSTAEVASTEDDKKRRFQPDRPMHRPRDSLLSWSSSFNNYEGVINWGFLILILGGVRLFLENVIKYGIRVNPIDWVTWLWSESRRDNYYHTPLWLLAFNLNFIYAYKIEKLLAKKVLPSWTGYYLHVIHLLLLTIAPMVVFYLWPDFFSLLGRMVITAVHTVVFLKLWSYVQVNHWCRDANNAMKRSLRHRSHSFRNLGDERCGSPQDLDDSAHYSAAHSEELVKYPDNLTLPDLYYFLCAPTLCYELNFPRTSRIRTSFLIRRAAEVVILSNLLVGLFQQWMIPSVRNSFQAFSDMDFIRTWERLLKLSIPNHLMWLIWFYALFHSFLNTIGELMKFADREFYHDWWNANDLGTFWKNWNLPVHKWALRHLYIPLIKSGYSKFTASAMVFLLSAFFHEYLVSVPLQMYKVLVFLGMLMQIPLISFSIFVARKVSPRGGNVIMWASLILGQPLGILVYFHDYAVRHIDVAALTAT